MSTSHAYKRVLLKISGEALKGGSEFGYDPAAVKAVASTVRAAVDAGVELSLVVGAGNVWRGAVGKEVGMAPVTADQMGMLATIMNALVLKDAFGADGVPCEVMTSIAMAPLGEFFDHSKASRYLEEGRIVICAGGTGHPFFTTDTTAALRALELEADVVIKGTKVDGIYDDDPKKNPAAVKFDKITYGEALSRRLKVMDGAAFTLCRDNGLPIIVFKFGDADGLLKVLSGDLSHATLVWGG